MDPDRLTYRDHGNGISTAGVGVFVDLTRDQVEAVMMSAADAGFHSWRRYLRTLLEDSINQLTSREPTNSDKDEGGLLIEV